MKIRRYTDIIALQSQMLVEGKTSYLSPSQSQAINHIQHNVNHLLKLAPHTELHIDEAQVLRHELLDILTPIVGYSEMLTDGWIGLLHPDQQSHIEIIHQCVMSLRDAVVSWNMPDALHHSA